MQVNGQTPYGQPQMQVNGQTPYGQPQMQMNGQTPYGQPQMQMNGQTPYGQPQMQVNGQTPYGQPQMQVNGQTPYGQPQMQMNGIPQAGSIPNGVPFGQAVKPPKKPFVMPAAVNVAGGILAIAAAAVFVCVLLLGKPAEKKSELAAEAMAVPASQQTVEGGDEISVDLSGAYYQLEIPETDGYRAAQEMAEGYVIEDSATRYLEESDLYAYTDDELWHAYYEILARAGVDLSEVDDEMEEYFQRKSWYEPTESLMDVLIGLDEEQLERYDEMMENGEDPSYDILMDAGILSEIEAYNMKLIEEYVTYGTTSAEGPGDALEDMLEEE
ncbi:MAG: YARHG domain-containing protein [bacterium]|nr:YARHG domain-containing protein [bacterium]